MNTENGIIKPGALLDALQDMALFVEVARARSFVRASERLGVPAATMSRRIAALEQTLGVRLFNRSTRRVELTSIGRRYLERCAHLVDEARVVHEQLHRETEGVCGDLRISMPVDFAIARVGPLLPEFARKYPGVRFQLDVSPKVNDLITEQIDLAIRLGPVLDEDLVVRHIGMIHFGLFAAETYLNLHGWPQTPADLAHHETITGYLPTYYRFGDPGLELPFPARGRFHANNVGLMNQLAERGMGIAMLPLDLARQGVGKGTLVRLLPEYPIQPLPVQAVTPTRQLPNVVRVFVDFLRAHLSFD